MDSASSSLCWSSRMAVIHFINQQHESSPAQGCLILTTNSTLSFDSFLNGCVACNTFLFRPSHSQAAQSNKGYRFVHTRQWLVVPSPVYVVHISLLMHHEHIISGTAKMKITLTLFTCHLRQIHDSVWPWSGNHPKFMKIFTQLPGSVFLLLAMSGIHWLWCACWWLSFCPKKDLCHNFPQLTVHWVSH